MPIRVRGVVCVCWGVWVWVYMHNGVDSKKGKILKMGSLKAAKLPRTVDSKKGKILKMGSLKAAKLPRMVDSKKRQNSENGFAEGSEAAPDG